MFKACLSHGNEGVIYNADGNLIDELASDEVVSGVRITIPQKHELSNITHLTHVAGSVDDPRHIRRSRCCRTARGMRQPFESTDI